MRLLILLDLKSILGQVMESFPLEKWEEIVLAAVKMLLKRTQKLSHPLDMSSLKSKCYKDLQLRCANADPNYGVLWFFSKLNPFDSARQVLASARRVMQYEIFNESISAIYFQAIMRRQMMFLGRSFSDLPKMLPLASCKVDDFTTGIISANRPSKATIKLLFGADEIRA